MPSHRPNPDNAAQLVDECCARARELLVRNLGPAGILAATPTAAADARGYAAVFGRDAAICALGMARSADPELQVAAATGLITLARYQARNGQIPKYVDPEARDADFWYLGCIDATLWWLIAVDAALAARRRDGPRSAGSRASIARSPGCWRRSTSTSGCCSRTRPATGPTSCRARATCSTPTRCGTTSSAGIACPAPPRPRAHFNHLFHPVPRDLPEYHRARLLQHYARRGRRDPGLYLSFVNLSFCGDEGDVFGNVLAILCGLADEAATHRHHPCARSRAAARPYPVRVVLHPILAAARALATLHGAPPAEPSRTSTTTAASGPSSAASG